MTGFSDSGHSLQSGEFLLAGSLQKQSSPDPGVQGSVSGSGFEPELLDEDDELLEEDEEELLDEDELLEDELLEEEDKEDELLDDEELLEEGEFELEDEDGCSELDEDEEGCALDEDDGGGWLLLLGKGEDEEDML